MHRGKYRLTAGSAAMAVMAAALAAVVIPSSAGAADASVPMAGSAATPLPAGAVRLGALAPETSLSLDVTLKLGNEAGLDALVAGLANPKSPYFGRFVGKDQFGPEFGLSPSAIARVTSTLASLGLHPGAVDPDRLYIPVTGTATAVEHAFGVTLARYRLPGGRVAYANSAAPRIPAAIAPAIDGVLGLDTVYQPQPLGHRAAAADTPKLAGPVTPGPVAPSPAAIAAHGPVACATATDQAIAMHGFTASQLASHYGMTSLYKVSDTGLGLSVAIAELEPNLATDIKGYEKCYGITTKVVNTTVGKAVGKGAGSGEAALDIENIAGIAPGVTIDDYQDGQPGLTPLYDIAAKVAAKDQDQVFSISYGLCEIESGSALLSAYQTVFKTLTAKGITTVAASGDSGSTGCFAGSSKSAALNPDAPASASNVFSVGGTAMTSAGILSTEVTWNGSGTANPGAGGGGVSATLCMPSYQAEVGSLVTGLISKNSVAAASCKSAADPHGYRRQVPDISANASGSSPYVMFYKNKWAGFYGTSAATSLVAAEAALIDASPFCSALGWNAGPHVMLPQALYLQVAADNKIVYLEQPPTLLHDITKGNNDDKASGYAGGLYPATTGYDEATGLGTPLLTDRTLPYFYPGMASDMCHFYARGGLGKVSTHGISPATVKAGKATAATVTGTGFVSIPFANAAEIITTGKKSSVVAEVWATCASHTSCKITLPKLKAGKYHVEMLVADYLPCRDGCKAFVTVSVK